MYKTVNKTPTVIIDNTVRIAIDDTPEKKLVDYIFRWMDNGKMIRTAVSSYSSQQAEEKFKSFSDKHRQASVFSIEKAKPVEYRRGGQCRQDLQKKK